MNPNYDYAEEPPSYQASYGVAAAAPISTAGLMSSQTGPVGPQTGPVGPQAGPVGPNFKTGPPLPSEQSYQNQGPAFSAIPQQEVH